MAPPARPTCPISGSAGEGLVARIDDADRVVGGMAGMIARADGLACVVALFRACADLVGAGVVGVGVVGVGATICEVAG